MPKISELTAATALNTSDVLPVVQGSSTRKIDVLTLLETLQGLTRWRPIPTADYTATPASTSRITMSDTTGLRVGLPIRYTYNSVTYYGVIDAVSAGTHIDVAGATLNTGQDLTDLRVGTPEMVVQMDLFVSGTYGDGTNDLLATDMNAYVRWQLPDAYLVKFAATHKTVDGTAQPKINVKVGGSSVSTADTNNGIQLSTAGAWVENGAIAINTTNYAINPDDAIEVACTAAGTDGDAADLTVSLLFVME